MKNIGYVSLIIGIIRLIGSGGSDKGIVAGIFMLALGIFLIYRANKKKNPGEQKGNDDFDRRLLR
ncbi:MAG: hypothetical protein K2H39_03830, partial [Paramuribaculum sp.]|nr:hypothetical protein [Paramuribaculum sp.]